VSPDPLPPHPPLERYYSREEERPALVNEMFDAGAPYYEWVCRVMSLGAGEPYRAQALREAGLEAGMRVLDVATGTGLVLRSAAAITGPSGLALGLDPSRGMLGECRKGCAAPLLQGRGEGLPFAGETFDMVSMGYGLRHVTDLRQLFAEYRRVLKPAGRVLLLEITEPRSSLGRFLNRLFLRHLVPGVARFGTGAEAARRMMDYFWETVENCVPPEMILDALRQSGFREAARKVMGGVLSEYRATKAPGPAPSGA
jgi:demethylmenaquinone methyltransferase / 2-methoxy-6-polyprenyl-1,4-benzoquinol methylase